MARKASFSYPLPTNAPPNLGSPTAVNSFCAPRPCSNCDGLRRDSFVSATPRHFLEQGLGVADTKLSRLSPSQLLQGLGAQNELTAVGLPKFGGAFVGRG